METRSKGRQEQSETGEACSESTISLANKAPEPVGSEGMSMTDLVRWLATREETTRWEVEERKRRRDEKLTEALNALKAKQTAFAEELRASVTERAPAPRQKRLHRKKWMTRTIWREMNYLRHSQRQGQFRGGNSCGTLRRDNRKKGGCWSSRWVEGPAHLSTGSSKAVTTLSIICWRLRGQPVQQESRGTSGWLN